MKPGAENRKKTITAAALGVVAIICAFYMYSTLFGGSSTPTPAPAMTTPGNTPAGKSSNTASSSSSSQPVQSMPGGSAAGVPAKIMATTSSSLDPTLDEAAMLRTESLVYSGTGRNIFSATYTLAPSLLPKNIPSARPMGPVGPPPPPPPPPTCPPTCPPINLKFFGTARRTNGEVQAFLLQGEDVYLASRGDIVARKYKIAGISANSIEVTDLQNNNTQSLPLQSR